MKKILASLCLLLAIGTPCRGQEMCEADTTVHLSADQIPQFPGNIYAWISTIMRYPALCQKAGVEGRLTVTFVVEKDGSLSNVRVDKSPYRAFSVEALRMLRLSPRWKPATIKGQAVRMRMNVPISFKASLPQETSEEQEIHEKVAAIYAHLPKLSPNERLENYATRELQQKIKRIREWNNVHLPGEAGFPDYDIWTHSQDEWDRTEVTRVTMQKDGTALAYVFCQQLDSEWDDNCILALHLKRKGKRWLVDDFLTNDGESFRQHLDNIIHQNSIN